MTAPELDPTQAVSAELNRRLFVGISAAATVTGPAIALGAQGSAADSNAPSVAEDDPAISVEHVKLKSDGVEVPAYAAWPVGAVRGTPSVVVIMHVWGVDTSIREAVRRLAKDGCAAIAPDLYARSDAPSGDGATDSSVFRPYAQRLERSQVGADVTAATLWLGGRFPATKVGIIGFCMGGRIVLNEIVDDGARFAAAAAFYGSVEGTDPNAIHVPLCGSYGARDTGIPAESVRAFAAALKVPNDFRIYDNAGHAFCDNHRASYVASAAEDAWTRTIAFLRKYLGAGAA
jgi:carboxymethylenebutenolidase